MSVVLFGCERWILRRIFGPKRCENAKWRRLHNEQLNSIYRSPNIVRAIKSEILKLTGHVSEWKKLGELSKWALELGLGVAGRTILECVLTISIIIVKPEIKNKNLFNQKSKQGFKWVNTYTPSVTIGDNTRKWVDSAQNRDYWRDFVNTALNLKVP